MEFQHELIIPDEGMPFKFFLFEGASGNYMREKHWHTSIEIFAVLEGCLSFYLNEEEHPLRAGELIIINSNEIHSIDAPKRNRTVVLQIPLRQFEDYYTAQRFIRFSVGGEGREADPLWNLIKRMYDSYIEKKNGYEFQVRSFFYEALYLLVTVYRKNEVQEKEIRHSRHLDTLSKITTYMREHYQEELKLSEVAAVFGYSAEYLSRMFHKYTKVNFKTYLQDIRMAYAYRDLMNTDATISQIAIEHGFSTNRSFTREFQKRYGVLPSQARGKRNEENENVKKLP